LAVERKSESHVVKGDSRLGPNFRLPNSESRKLNHQQETFF